ncbi:MAG: hypothetical protein EYC70_12190 [Planctomycetota bacterium]|nr:MAG: hypothetical protein EYC70_12190 [Planctomycetota bacterium]
MSITTLRFLQAASLCALFSLGSCQSGHSESPPPPQMGPVRLTNEFQAVAEVVAIERDQRLVTLRRADGSLFVVRAGDGVRNLDQVAVGDDLRIRYREELTAVRSAKDPESEPAEIALAGVRAPLGEKPAGGVGMSFRLVVRIESIDLDRDIVVFSPGSGELIAHRIVTAEGRAFVRTLEVGNTVELTYAEMLALSVEEL